MGRGKHTIRDKEAGLKALVDEIDATRLSDPAAERRWPLFWGAFERRKSGSDRESLPGNRGGFHQLVRKTVDAGANPLVVPNSTKPAIAEGSAVRSPGKS
ncbi:MAG: hypothetical protein U1E76_16125 [Planctomycetota bacterium]